MSLLHCPRCDAENPAESSFCNNCGARLSAPQKSSADPGADEQLYFASDLPDWLDDELQQVGDGGAESSVEDGVPDWLHIFQEDGEPVEEDHLPAGGLNAHEPEADAMPDWLEDMGEKQDGARSDEARSSAASADTRAADAASAWLNDLSPDEKMTQSDQAADEAADELHAWLDNLEAPAESEALRDEQEVEADSDEFPPFIPPPEIEAPGDDAEEGFHSWLQGEEPSLSMEETTEDPPIDSGDEFADWLAAAQDESGTPPEAAPAAGGEFPSWTGVESDADEHALLSLPDLEPDWLERPASDEGSSTREEADTPGQPADAIAAEIEAWLSEEEEGQSGSISTAQSTSEEPTVPDDAFFEWLATLDDAEAEPDPSARVQTTEVAGSPTPPSDVPSDDEADGEAGDAVIDTGWLDELAEAGDAAGHPEAEPAEEMPDWLRTMAPTGATGPLPPLPERDERGATEPPIDEETFEAFPGWLQGVTAELPSPDESVREAEEDEGDTLEPAPETTGADEDAIPNWLLEDVIAADVGDVEEDLAYDAGSEEPAQEERREPWSDSIFEGVSEPLDDEIPSEDLPAWFSDVMANIGGETDAEEALVGPPEMENVPPLLASDALPTWLDSPFTEELEAEPTPLEEIPEWLRPSFQEQRRSSAEREQGVTPAVESSEEWNELLGDFAGPKDRVELEEADVPEWLEALRPEEAAPVAPATTATTPAGDAVEEGPLAGLSGVVGIAPVVAHSPQAERVVLPGTTPEQEAQASLLRQLTRSEQTGVTIVETPLRSEETSLPFRSLMALLLLAAIFAGILFSESLPPMSAPPTLEPVAAFAEAIDAVDGRPVLVAVDYTPAFAGALTAQATVLLEQLAGNGNRALLASQSAAGITLATGLAAQTNDLIYESIGYVPGGAMGLRRLAGCLQDSTPCTTLYGANLDSALAEDLTDAALLVVITGERDSLVGWLEQVGATTELPVLTILTQALEPMAAPYLDSNQIVASVAGAAAAQQYAQSQGSGADVTTIAPLVFARWLGAALFVLGAIYYLVGAPLQRKGQHRR